MAATETELHACACGDPECHEMTKSTYARGHAGKAQKFRGNPQPGLLPGPDDDLDLGILDLEDAPGPDGPQPDRAAPDSTEPPAEDEVIRPLGFPPPGKGKAGKAPRGAVRVTAATRQDINAKIELGLSVPAHIWEMRDPYCGGTAVQQVPATARAFTNIVCRSPDLVAWFTGPGGGFMEWFEVIMAVAPVAQMAWAHHVAHAIGAPETSGQPAPDMRQYAA